MPIALSLGGSLAYLAVTTPLPLMHIRAVRMRKIPLPLRRCGLNVAHSGIHWRCAWPLDVSYRRLFRPGLAAVGISIHVGDDRSSGARGVGSRVFERGRSIGGLGGDLRPVGGGGADVAVAFEDFFGGYVGGVVEEGGVVEDGLEVFGDLWEGVSVKLVWIREKG